jgi:MYXO-CTERM domain-containing protein
MPDESVFLAGGPHSFTEVLKPDGTAVFAGTDTDVRWSPTVTALGNGSVLVVGGRGPGPNDNPLGTASLFDGSTVKPGLSPPPLALHTATRLDDGTVLVTGGYHSFLPPNPLPTTDVVLFNPKSGKFDAQPPLVIGRASHTATLLVDGKTVLLVGGRDHSAELYDTTNGSTPILSPIPEAIGEHAALLLPEKNQVLITGGGKTDGSSGMAVHYDIPTKTFSTPTEHAREWHTATLLPDGKLMMAGGFQGAGSEATASVDLFDPRKRTFVSIASMHEERLAHTATLVAEGRVIVAGGLPGQYDGVASSKTFETWKDDHFEGGGKLIAGRAYHAATLLTSGRVLLTGGSHSTLLLASAEIIDPEGGMSVATKGPMSHARYRHAAVRLPSGSVLIAGGITLDKDHPYDGLPVATAEIYNPTTDTFTDVAGSAPLGRDTRAAVLPSGEVLIVGDQIAYRFDEATGELSVAGSAPDWAFGAGVLPGGRLLVCGVTRCDMGTEAGLGTAPVINGVQRDGHTLTVFPGGEVFAAGFTPTHAQHTFSYRTFPPEAPRPVIDSAPVQLVIGESAILKGKLFQHMSARGTNQALLARPEILPRVIFMPAASGAPVTATLQAWSDASITFTAPQTPYTGGGWLVVMVDGVASEGAWTKLAPAAQGAACGFDTECASTHCADGVCCDHACNDGCLSCLASVSGLGADGMCGPISAQSQATSECRCTSNFDCPVDFVCLLDGRCEPAGSPGPDGPGCNCNATRESQGGRELGAAVTMLALLVARRRRDQKV